MGVFVKQILVNPGLVLLLATALSPFSIGAQVSPSPAPDQLQALQDLADQVKAALQRGDLDTANRLSSNLLVGIFKQRNALEPTPQEKLTKLEQTAAPNARERFYALSNLAKTAFDAGELNKAEDYARELLSVAPQYQRDWNYGNAIFFGHMVIGRVALKRDANVLLAKSSLLASAQTSGSPQLNSFGPNMSLAKDLLTAGERDTVLEFFTLCRSFWKFQPNKLDEWTATVKGGGIPEFGANLKY
jgi:hypothetical protein